MKNLSFLIGVFFNFMTSAYSQEVMEIISFKETDIQNMYSIEVKEYSQVKLDCIGFAKGFYFYKNKEISYVYMNEDDCFELKDYLFSKLELKEKLYLDYDKEESSVEIKEKKEED